MKTWKTIKGYGNYEISSCGTVRNKRRGNVLSPCKETKGYLSYLLSHKGKSRRFLAHRLVYEQFVGNILNQIDHINRDKEDNRVENLRDVSPIVNRWNCGKNKNNTSGTTGVGFYRNFYVAEICVKGKRYRARFKSIEEAILWRKHKEMLAKKYI